MKECKYDSKLLEKIEYRQRVTRAWFFNGLIILGWLIFMYYVVQALLFVNSVIPDWMHGNFIDEANAQLILRLIGGYFICTSMYFIGHITIAIFDHYELLE